MASANMELFARCAGGFEDVLADELRGLGMRRVRPQVGGVSFFGRPADMYRACLWSRVATRIQLVLARVPSTTAEEFYVGMTSIEWERHVRSESTIAVRAHGTNEELRNTSFTALKAKDAVCDRLRELRGARPSVDTHDPDLSIDVAVHPRKATVYLNLSGPSLHRRGYREEGVQTEAPLKETLAAGMLLVAGWPALARVGGILVDPMCGSGTIAIEAALIATNTAPGLLRDRWGFEGWLRHDPGLWSHVVSDAAQKTESPHGKTIVLAGDIDKNALAIAQDNARRAQVSHVLQLFCDDAVRVGRHLRGVFKRGVRPGVLVTNPPYGERLGTHDDLVRTNAALAGAVEALPEDWRVAILTPNASVDTALGRVPQRVVPCHNGPIEVKVRLYSTDPVGRQTHELVSLAGVRREVALADERSVQFAARLRKVAREKLRRAKREGLSCVRIYDSDLPDYPMTIDVFDGAGACEGERRAVVTRTRRVRKARAEREQRRMADAMALIAAVLDIAEESVYVPGRSDERHVPFEVCEDGLVFQLDLVGVPDAGLSPSQRELRTWICAHARGKRVLNLGGGASAATACAAKGGATRTQTVEPFEDRAELIRKTLKANGFGKKMHRVTCASARAWTEHAAKERQEFDVILYAPPAWINKDEQTFVVRAAQKLLAKNGALKVIQ